MVLFFTTKVSTLISVEGGEALSRSLNDKIPNIIFDNLLKLVVDLPRRLPHFPAKMSLVRARALLSFEKMSYSSCNLKLRNVRILAGNCSRGVCIHD